MTGDYPFETKVISLCINPSIVNARFPPEQVWLVPGCAKNAGKAYPWNRF
jgi:hypothetical protein